MIIPLDSEQMKTATDEEILKAYLNLGFDQQTAEVYLYMLDRGPSVAKSRVLTVQAAKALAEQADHAELLAEVNKSIASNIAFVRLTEVPDGMALSSPNDVTIEWFPDESETHLTMVNLGKSEDLSLAQTRKVVAVVNEVAARYSALHGIHKGVKAYVPGISELQMDLIKELTHGKVKVLDSAGPYVLNAPTEDGEVNLHRLTAVVGPYRYDAMLNKADGAHVANVAKASEEKRFTLAPMYIPGQYDAQGDWADPDDLQKAVWDFSRGEKLIALQHRPKDGPAGEAVELMIIPWEHKVPMFKADGTSQEVTFPAGTPWLGVIWSEEVWPLVKAGKVRGYSIGGRANLLNVSLPEADA